MRTPDLGEYCYEVKWNGTREILVKWRVESIHINGDKRYYMLKETEGNGIDIINVDDIHLCYILEEEVIKALDLYSIGQQECVEAA